MTRIHSDINLNLKNSFISITLHPNWHKNIIIGGLLQLIFWVSLFFYHDCWIIMLGIIFYMCGYLLLTIKKNINTDNFTTIKWNFKPIIFTGAKFIIALLVFFTSLYLSIMLLGIIVLIPFILIAQQLSTEYSQYICWLGVAIAGFITLYGIYPYLIITFPTMLANYINEEKFYSLIEIKKIFKIFKHNWKVSLKILAIMLLSPFTLIPFAGFYIALALTRILAKYIEITNKIGKEL